MATDTFGKPCRIGETLYVPAVITAIDANDVFVLSYTNEDESTTTITAQSGPDGRTDKTGRT
jgi:hypothetical protein